MSCQLEPYQLDMVGALIGYKIRPPDTLVQKLY